MRLHPITTLAANLQLKALCAITGIIGGILTHIFGGLDVILEMLLVFMVIDYLSGMAVAGIYKKSKKTKNGGLSSKIGWKGLCRKCMTLAFVAVGQCIDRALGVDYIRNAIIVGFSTNELVSIIENAGLMGLPIPEAVTNAVELLKKSGDKPEEEKQEG